MTRFAFSLFLAVVLVGCASSYRPVIDPQTSAHPERYEADLAACKGLAAQGAGAGTGALAGAGIGYALGQVLARTMGGRGQADHAARGSAVVGGATMAAQANAAELAAIKACMSGRGYSVIR